LSLGALLAVSSIPAAAPALAAEPADVYIQSPNVSVAGPGSTFDVQVMNIGPNGAASGIQASVTFDKSLLQLVSVARPATDWGTADIFIGPTGDLTQAAKMAAAIAAANGTGKLASVAASFTPPTTLDTTNDVTFLLLRFQVVACPAAPATTTQIGLPVGPADTLVLDGAGEPAAPITGLGATVTPCVSNTGNPITRVSSSLEAGFLGLQVDPNISIPLIRQVENSVDVPVQVFSDGIWSLKVEDAMPAGKTAPDRGHMTDGIPATKRLALPMSAQVDGQPVRTLDVDPIGDLVSDEGIQTPVVTLRQFVGPSDPPASYSIELVFTATSGF
jgi:hypothetical protein